MTTVELNTEANVVEVYASALDIQARADINALEARTMEDWNYVPDVHGGATRTQAAWNAERMSFSDFEAGGGVSAWNRALTWLNGADRRTLFLPSGQVDLDTTSLDPIIGNNKAIRGQGFGTKLVKPGGSRTNNLVFKIGDTTDQSAQQVYIGNFQIDFTNWDTAVGAAFIADGVHDLMVEILRAHNVVSLLELGPTADVFAKRVMLQVHSGSWRAEGNQHFIHQQRAIAVDIPKCLCNSPNGGTGYAYYLEAKNHSGGLGAGNNDGFYLDRFEVWAGNPGASTHVPSIVVLDATNGQIANGRIKSHALDHTTDSAVLIKAASGAHRVEKINFYQCRSTPVSGQFLRIEHNGTGIWTDINATDFMVSAQDEAVIEVSGSGTFEACRLNGTITYKGASSPQLDALVKIGLSNVSLDVVSGPGTGFSPYDHVVEVTADVNNLNLDINDNGADVGLVKHFAYSSGGNDIIVNGVRHPSEGEFTPIVSFATPGDLSVTYAKQLGRWWERDGRLFFDLSLVFTPTYTTASGLFLVQGLPKIPKGPSTHIHSLTIGEMSRVDWPSWVKAYTATIPGTAISILLRRILDAGAMEAATTAEFPSGTEYTLSISGSFMID